jgi:alpha-beta hydrolase superfamily lysophospholipase
MTVRVLASCSVPLAAALLAGCAAGPAPRPEPAAPPAFAARVACPEGLLPGTDCRTGRDANGAHVWLAVPPGWTGTLVVHAHGGPELGEPRAERPVEDLQRWSVWNRAGYAYAGSGFAQGGVAVRAAADDVERSRRLFVAAFGAPKRTVLHGQSWGAGVAMQTVERHQRGLAPYDAVLLTSGVLGGRRSYDARMDLRAVWQAVCGNHPESTEAPYPLWQGLPAGSTLTRAELARRAEACTGARAAPAARTPEQQRRLDTLVRLTTIPAEALAAHLAWATWHFQDIAANRTGGRAAFGNRGVVYGDPSRPDDAALDARVPRFDIDPAARAWLADDTETRARLAVPVLQLHATGDPTAFVELASAFAERMRSAGNGGRLVQVFTDEREHSYLNDPLYVAAIGTLLDWQAGAATPTPRAVAERCAATVARFPARAPCRVQADAAVGSLDARSRPR